VSASSCMGLRDSIDALLDLPVPVVTLPASTKPQAREPSPPRQATPPAPQRQPSEQQSATIGNSQAPAPLRKQSFGDPEADPWGSPDMHRGHNHASYAGVSPQMNGGDAPSATRTTSQFTTQSTANSANPGPIQPSSLSSEGGWGGYNGGAQPFAPPSLGDGGFGALPSREGGPNAQPDLGTSMVGRQGGSANEEVITITALSEKEGMFMFQHRNYEVASSRRTTKVVRRYSDFVWLLDCLHKRYPFRQLPLLPPKRVGSKSPSCNDSDTY
jgi:sorting nexin-8